MSAFAFCFPYSLPLHPANKLLPSNILKCIFMSTLSVPVDSLYYQSTSFLQCQHVPEPTWIPHHSPAFSIYTAQQEFPYQIRLGLFPLNPVTMVPRWFQLVGAHTCIVWIPISLQCFKHSSNMHFIERVESCPRSLNLQSIDHFAPRKLKGVYPTSTISVGVGVVLKGPAFSCSSYFVFFFFLASNIGIWRAPAS